MLRQHPSLQCKSAFTDNFNVIVIWTKDTFIGGFRNSGNAWQSWTQMLRAVEIVIPGSWGVTGHRWTLMLSIVASYRQCYSVNKPSTLLCLKYVGTGSCRFQGTNTQHLEFLFSVGFWLGVFLLNLMNFLSVFSNRCGQL